MSDFLGKLQGPSKIFVHFRNQEYQTYLDISDGRMISFRNEVLRTGFRENTRRHSMALWAMN